MPKPKLTKDQAQIWLEQNEPNIELIKWGNGCKKKSVFKNKHTGKEFELSLNYIKKRNKKGLSFGFSKKEIKEAQKKGLVNKYGVDNPFKLEKFQTKARGTKIESGQIFTHKGMTVAQLSKLRDDISYTTLISAYHLGVDLDEITGPPRVHEKAIRNYLTSLGLDFRYRQKLPEHTGKKKDFRAPDFCFFDLKKIIEIEGDHIHANPKKYNEDDLIIIKERKCLAKEIWKKDEERDCTYKKNGYDTLKIWSSEIDLDFEQVKLKIKNFLGVK